MRKKSTAVWIIVFSLLIFGLALIWVDNRFLVAETSVQKAQFTALLLMACLFFLFLGGVSQWVATSLGNMAFFARLENVASEWRNGDKATVDEAMAACKSRLRARYGPFWRHQVRVLLVVGESKQLAAMVPGLGEQHWVEGDGVVLLWGGSPSLALKPLVDRWRGLRHGRLLDAVVWVLDKSQSANSSTMTAGVQHLQALAETLRWELPLHLLEVCESQWAQSDTDRQPIGCELPLRLSTTALETQLNALLTPLRQRGLAQIESRPSEDFCLRLSGHLSQEGIARWKRTLSPLFGRLGNGVSLRGMWFALPLTRLSHADHVWMADPAWLGIARDKANIRRHGWPLVRVGYVLFLGVAMFVTAGLLLSFYNNDSQIRELRTTLTAAGENASGDEQIVALSHWMQALGRLDQRVTYGDPLYLRFGLSQTRAMRDALWPRYVAANNRLLRDAIANHLQRQLQALVDLPPDSPLRSTRAHNAYLHLKAYLMMARPEKSDSAFLIKTFHQMEPDHSGITTTVWKGLSPALWQFYADHLKTSPDWRIEMNSTLVAQARQVLLGQLGKRNGESAIYQKILESTSHHYPDLGLQQMVGETEAWPLFSTDESVPGAFTRQAWEAHIRASIDNLVEARREQIDWVLSDKEGDILPELTPDALKVRLTERYFQDYARAWLRFLNSLRWQRANGLGEVIDQLTLMSDIRQSPLVALMNTVSWHGQAGARRSALADSLVASAQKLISRDDGPALDQRPVLETPLQSTFGPLLAVMDKHSQKNGDDEGLSLQAFLNRVTRVRLKLQQISLAADPQAMTLAMAQTVLQGKSIDLTDTQSYGSLMAASLGSEWGGFGQALFVKPLQQAWQEVLQPAGVGINRQWQREVVDHWDAAFVGRYPFVAHGSDASLAMLGMMIRADSGRIEQFLKRQLNGVLRKEGSVWVEDARHSLGLRVDPEFLSAINELSHLADVLFTDGGVGLSFELQGKAVRDVVQTSFILNGARHQYFNQKESWQRFIWPGQTDHPGASLSWTSVHSGEGLFGDYQGTWGLIRLLEIAHVTPLDHSDGRYLLVLKAPDGLRLTWHLRTELGAGPLSLLKLRGFKLPRQVFLSARDSAPAVAQSGMNE